MKLTGRWRFDIKYGPEGEAKYAWVYDETNRMICTAKTHDAACIVEAANAYAVIAGRRALESKGGGT
ncbi:hypothetical protein ACFPLB_04045 [Aquamicrobium segne]|uniref:DUF1508 domain-containing protein n=1 Tax=Aquamicrobium segne TaxID=469547 RepID=A0ABW0GUG1_9HYPH